MQLSTPHPDTPLLLGFAVFRNRQKLDNLRSFHMYKKESYLHTIQQEFQSNAGALEEMCSPIHDACVCESATLVKKYMELVTAKQRRAGWQCMLGFFTTPPSRSSHASLTESELMVANAWSSANALFINANNTMSWERTPCILPSISACLREYESFEPDVSNNTSEDAVTQRPQVDLWQQWGSDLELASPRSAIAFELPLFRNHSNNNSNISRGDTPSPSCSSLSSNNMHLLPWTRETIPKHCPKIANTIPNTQSDETLGVSVIGVACSIISPQSNFETHLGESSADGNIFVNMLPLDLNQMASVNAVDLPGGNKLSEYCNHSLDCGMTQPMSSASNTYSSGDERELEEENAKILNGLRVLKTISVNKAKLRAKPTKSSSSRAGTGRLSKLTKAELTHYFSMPITQASKELNVGLTVLKKRCRVFGIPRWPHRKMKSINGLIQNIQDLVKTDISGDNVKNSDQVQVAVEELEKQKKEMQDCPSIQLPEKTKRLRQACFKASYRKRRQALHEPISPDLHDHQNAPAHINYNNGSLFFYPQCD